MRRSDWPDTSIGHVAKYVTKNYRATPAPFCLYFDSTRQNRERLVITALKFDLTDANQAPRYRVAYTTAVNA